MPLDFKNKKIYIKNIRYFIKGLRIMKYKSDNSVHIAEALIQHFGFPELVKICKTSQPAISLWKKNGIPYAWEMFFRKRNPQLQLWKDYPL